MSPPVRQTCKFDAIPRDKRPKSRGIAFGNLIGRRPVGRVGQCDLSRRVAPTVKAAASELAGLAFETCLSDTIRQVGVCTGNILKGEKPADLPVVQ
jgi:hypothetical protein